MKKVFSSIVCVFTLSACSQGMSTSEVKHESSGENTKPKVQQIEKADRGEITLINPDSAKVITKGLFTGELQVSLDTGFVVTLLITNTQTFGVPVQYRSGMTADVKLVDPQGKKVWAWSDDMMFTQAIRDEVIPAGKVNPVRFNLPQTVVAQVNKKGYQLIATYKGQLTESKGVAMADVTLSLDPFLN